MGRVALLAAALCCLAAAPAPDGTVPLDRDTVLVPGGFDPGRQPDGNSVVMRGRDGAIIVDTGRHTAQVARIDAAAAWLGKRPAVIVNTHWHLDHVSGNIALRAANAGIAVWASGAIDGALAGFLKDSAAQGRQAIDKGDLPQSVADDVRGDIATIARGVALRPDHVVTTSARVRLAGRAFDLHLARRAATAGDVWLYDRAHARAIVGDLVTYPVPFLDTACPEGWSAALREVAATGFVTIVPGHGPVMSRADFDGWRGAFDAFVACARDAGQPVDACVDGWLGHVGGTLDDAGRRRARGMTAYYVDRVRSGALEANCTA